MCDRSFDDVLPGPRLPGDRRSSSVAVIRRRDGAFLFNLRDDLPSIAHPGAWSLLGGGCDVDETPLEALRRELWEEAEIVLDSASALFSVTDDEGSGDRIDVFECVTRTRDDDMHLHEGQELRYLTAEELDCVAAPAFVRDVVRRILDRGPAPVASVADGPPGHLLGGSYPAGRPELARDVWGLLPAAIRRAAEHDDAAGLVFALIKPDAVAERKQYAIVDVIESQGIRVLDVQPTGARDQSRFEDLYRYNLTVNNEQNMSSTWWLNRRVFEAGPGLALLLMVPPSVRGLGDGGRVFADLKGPSDPFVTEPGQIRHRFSSVNTSLNLVHGSDDGLTGLREALIFFGESRLREGLLGSSLASSAWQRVALDSVRVPQVDLDPLLAAVRVRIAVEVSCSRRRARHGVEALAQLVDLVQAEPTPEELSAALTVLSHHETTSVTVEDHFAHVAAGVPLMTMNHTEALRFMAAAEASGTSISPWEQLTLETSAFYGHMTARRGRSLRGRDDEHTRGDGPSPSSTSATRG